MKHPQLIAAMRADLTTIITGLPAALRHLDDWVGGYPATASGAPPSTSRTPVECDDDGDTVRTVTVGDPAQRLRLAMLGHLRSTALQARRTVAGIDGVELPVTPTDDASDLAVMLWAMKRIEAEDAHARDLDRLSRSLRHCSNLVAAYQPPTPQEPTGCYVHRSVGDTAIVYAGDRCVTCWRFRRQHDVDPTPDILRAWSKGMRPTAAQIAEAKRRKMRKAS
jgi:hypothetical protein